MTATEMHDLLLASLKALQSTPIWTLGTAKGFEHIQYCRHCHYSKEHGHGDTCLIVRLERATHCE